MLGIVWLFRFCADSVVWGIWNKKFLLQFGLPWFVFWLSLLSVGRPQGVKHSFWLLWSGERAGRILFDGSVVGCLLELEGYGHEGGNVF